jgi:hypothetical protein
MIVFTKFQLWKTYKINFFILFLNILILRKINENTPIIKKLANIVMKLILGKNLIQKMNN